MYPKFDVNDDIAIEFDHPDQKCVQYIRNPIYPYTLYPKYTVYGDWASNGPRYFVQDYTSYTGRSYSRFAVDTFRNQEIISSTRRETRPQIIVG